MAKHDDDYNEELAFFEVNPYDWDDKYATLFDDFPNRDVILHDPMVLYLVNEAYIGDTSMASRATARAMIDEYFWETYEYDFDEYFDWDAFDDLISPPG